MPYNGRQIRWEDRGKSRQVAFFRIVGIEDACGEERLYGVVRAIVQEPEAPDLVALMPVRI